MSLPYVASPGSVKTCLEKIQQASVPQRVTVDFIQTVLNIKGGTGSALVPFLKKIGFVSSEGTPTEFYKSFRNPSVGKKVMADAIKTSYVDLGNVNEYFYSLSDEELKALIIQVTGQKKEDSTVKLVFSTLKNLINFADFSQDETTELPAIQKELGADSEHFSIGHKESVGLNLSYTINLNLPATNDQSVFNAIFKSLKENLLKND